MPSKPPAKKCGWASCGALLVDHRASFCNEHKEPGSAMLRAARNARYAGGQRRLVNQAVTAVPGSDGGVALPTALTERLVQAVARLERAVDDFDGGVSALRGWELDAHLEGWAELKPAHELRLRFALAELRLAARHAVEVLSPALARRS